MKKKAHPPEIETGRCLTEPVRGKVARPPALYSLQQVKYGQRTTRTHFYSLHDPSPPAEGSPCMTRPLNFTILATGHTVVNY